MSLSRLGESSIIKLPLTGKRISRYFGVETCNRFTQPNSLAQTALVHKSAAVRGSRFHGPAHFVVKELK